MATPSDDNAQVAPSNVSLLPHLPAIKPPTKSDHYRLFDGSRSAEWLHKHIQLPWWNSQNCTYSIESEHHSAHFSHTWNNDPTNPYALKTTINTTSEYTLLREIVWMFFKPTTCKHFKVLADDRVVVNAENICSINSVSLNGLHAFLEQFCDHMTQLLRLQTFCANVEQSTSHVTVTYSYFTDGLKECLEPIHMYLKSFESAMVEQQHRQTEPKTIILLFTEMRPHFRRIQFLHELLVRCALDFNLYSRKSIYYTFTEREDRVSTEFLFSVAAHICAIYLLTKLLVEVNAASDREYANLAAALFIKSLKMYLNIIDLWWTECRLEDWQNEFLIEKCV